MCGKIHQCFYFERTEKKTEVVILALRCACAGMCALSVIETVS